MSKVLVIGNGPSTKQLDFKSVNIETVGMNAAYRYWDRIDFRPTYYACLDDTVVISHQDEIRRLIREGRILKFFLHYNILEKYPELAELDNVLIFEQGFNRKDPDSIFYNNFCTTGSFSIRWMISLGYKHIGLIGIDCNYVEIVKSAVQISEMQLEIVSDSQENPNYFFEDYQQKGDKYNIPNNPKTKVNRSVHADSVHRIFEDCERLNMNVQLINTSVNNLDFENIMKVDDFLNMSFSDSTEDFFEDDMNRFVLFTTLYENIKDGRLQELITCLKENYLNHFIDSIYIFFESDKNMNDLLNHVQIWNKELFNLITKKKFKIIIIDDRPSYRDYFEYAERHLPKRKIIIANSDIYFNGSLGQLYEYDLTNKFLLLTRWNEDVDQRLFLPSLDDLSYPWTRQDAEDLLTVNIYTPNKYPKFNWQFLGQYPSPDTNSENKDVGSKYMYFSKLRSLGVNFRNEFSQDAWIFKTPFPHFRKFPCNYKLGTFKCDTLLNVAVTEYAIENESFEIKNPCLTIQCVHIDRIPGNRAVSYDKYREQIDDELLEKCKNGFIPWSEL